MSRISSLVVGLSVCLAVAGCDRGDGQGSAATVGQHSGAASSSTQDATATAKLPRCWLDKLNDKAIAGVGSDVDLPMGRPFDIAGWLVDSDDHAVDSMQLVLTPVAGGDARSFPAVMGVVRVDVAQALRSDGAKNSGFTVHDKAVRLAPGRYKATARAKSGSAELRCDFSVVFNAPMAD